jgi:PAS domain-containing protein
MSPIGISRVNNQGQVIYGNPRWMEMSGCLATNEQSEESFLELVHPDDRQTLDERWIYALKNQKQVGFELRWGTRDRFLWTLGELVPEIVGEEVST